MQTVTFSSPVVNRRPALLTELQPAPRAVRATELRPGHWELVIDGADDGEFPRHVTVCHGQVRDARDADAAAVADHLDVYVAERATLLAAEAEALDMDTLTLRRARARMSDALACIKGMCFRVICLEAWDV